MLTPETLAIVEYVIEPILEDRLKEEFLKP